MDTVLITGGTGLVGRHLSARLIEKGYVVSFLSRASQKTHSIETFVWNHQKSTIDKSAFENIDYIIHLAGANIGEKRWTNNRKRLILDSRVKTGQLIFDRIQEQKKSLKAFIS
ncbi:MAG: epimerase, partial [Bacteroidetes bacterium]